MQRVVKYVSSQLPCGELLVICRNKTGGGEANNHYSISGFDAKNNKCLVEDFATSCSMDGVELIFQDGPVKEVGGYNGITVESLLCVIKDRLESFQTTPYACSENAEALEGIVKALEALNKRTARRVAEGVEGTSNGS